MPKKDKIWVKLPALPLGPSPTESGNLKTPAKQQHKVMLVLTVKLS